MIMEYLAILGYSCGCSMEANYGFVKPIHFHANDSEEFNSRVLKLQSRKPRAADGFQCRRNSPIEVLVFDEDLKLVLKWKRE